MLGELGAGGRTGGEAVRKARARLRARRGLGRHLVPAGREVPADGCGAHPSGKGAPARLGNRVRYWKTASGVLLGISSSSHAPSFYVCSTDVSLTNMPKQSGNKSTVGPTQ